MKITRQILIDLCDKFLNNKIDKAFIQDFAWNTISSNELDFVDDEIISETIFEWDNEDINFEINKTNIQLWKKRLITSQDNLTSYNFWNSHIEKQKEICVRYNSIWKPINKKFTVGVSPNLDKDPIQGIRHASQKGTTGWLIWTGEYSESENFFKFIHAENLLQLRPDIVKYLGLDVGFKFLKDNEGSEEVSYKETLY